MAPNKRVSDGHRHTDRLTDRKTDRQTCIGPRPDIRDGWGEGQSELQENCVRAGERPAWHVEGNPAHAVNPSPSNLPSDINLPLVLSPPYDTTTKWRLSTDGHCRRVAHPLVSEFLGLIFSEYRTLHVRWKWEKQSKTNSVMGNDGFSTRHRLSPFREKALTGKRNFLAMFIKWDGRTYCFSRFFAALSLGLRMSRTCQVLWTNSTSPLAHARSWNRGKAIGSSAGLDLIFLRYIFGPLLFVRVSTQGPFHPRSQVLSLALEKEPGDACVPVRHGCLETPVRTCWKVEWE